MLTNYFFRDLFNDRWGDPANLKAIEPPSGADKDRAAARGIFGRLRRLYRGSPSRPSPWSFTIPSETPDAESETSAWRRNECDATQPKFLNIAKALSRNC